MKASNNFDDLGDIAFRSVGSSREEVSGWTSDKTNLGYDLFYDQGGGPE